MEKILLLSDSACDLSKEVEASLGCVRILDLPMIVGDKPVTDRVDIDPSGIYNILNTSDDLPTTAALTPFNFDAAFVQAAEEGYTDLIYYGLNGKGSSTFNNAIQGKKFFAEEHPELAAKLKVHLVDGRCYSYGYGFPLFLAARKVNDGATVREILDFLVDFMDHRMEYVTLFTLKYAKKSGRIGACAAFVGEVLGLRPIMGFPDGVNTVHDKVRGDKAVIPKLVEYYRKNVASPDEDYCIVYGEDEGIAHQLAEAVEAVYGKKPSLMGQVGACVAVNSGPRLLGITFRTKSTGHYTGTIA